jgi:hypothetical protein
MKTIVIVYYKIVKKTIDILHNETIWVIWEIFWKKTNSGLFRAICEIARNSEARCFVLGYHRNPVTTIKSLSTDWQRYYFLCMLGISGVVLQQPSLETD